MSFGEILFDADGLPPLYPLLLKPWCGLFGGTHASRWLSVVLGSLAVPLMWMTAKTIADERTAVWTSVLLAASPIHIYYSQEARPYALYFLVVAALYLGQLLVRHDDTLRHWMIWIVSSVAAIYCHYFGAFVIGILGVWLIHRRGFWSASLVIALLSLPACFLLIGDIRFQQTYGTVPDFDLLALGFTYFSAFSGYSLGPSVRELHHMPAQSAIELMLPWLFVVGVLGAWLFVVGFRSKNREFFVQLSLVGVPVLLMGVLGDLLGFGYEDRYAVWISFPMILLLAHGLQDTRSRRIVQVGLACMLVLFLWARFQYGWYSTYWKEEPRSVVEFIEARDAQPVVTSFSIPIRDSLRFYRPQWELRAILGEAAIVKLASDIDTSSIADVIQASEWYVTKWPQNEAEGATVTKELLELGLIERHDEIGHFAVYLVNLDFSPPPSLRERK